MSIDNTDITERIGVSLPDYLTTDAIDDIIEKRRQWFEARFGEAPTETDKLDAEILELASYIDVVKALRAKNIFAIGTGVASFSEEFIRDREIELNLLINKRLL